MSRKLNALVQLSELPEDVGLLLSEELSVSDRPALNVVAEALRIRRAVLEGLGIDAAGTDPGKLLKLVTEAVELGVAIRGLERGRC
ncbi:MAG TPA: hypothetical protein VF815_47630 [Myxococcaceae bacterium]